MHRHTQFQTDEGEPHRDDVVFPHPATPLVLVGAGKMGGALLSGWLASGLDPKAVIAIDPAPPPDTAAMLSEAGIAPRADVPAVTARVVVVAVKPQMMAGVLPGLKPLVGPETIVLSIAAGKTIASFAAVFGDVAVVRAMPNTPAQVGRGITAAVANARATADDRALVTDAASRPSARSPGSTTRG